MSSVPTDCPAANYIIDISIFFGLKDLSTTHDLVDMVHTWLLSAEHRGTSHVVLLHYKKSFNDVDHTVLSPSMRCLGC